MQSAPDVHISNSDEGGIFDSPARKFKSTFGHSQFFIDYPHAFPGFICGAIGATAIPFTIFFAREVYVPPP
jgi:hypothetical protein